MKMQVKVMPFLQKKGNRVAKAAIEFSGPIAPDNPLGGFQMVGFTICDDKEKGLFVLFPSALMQQKHADERRTFFFLRPSEEGLLDKLQDIILDTYEAMTAFNQPRVRVPVTQSVQA